jgi:hypothetical protein
MQILINVPDTLPKNLIQKRIKQLEESLKKEARRYRLAGSVIVHSTYMRAITLR